jgi:predicted transcriptional regulator of viral defense system
MKFEHLLEYVGERPYFELREVLAWSDDSPKSLKNQLSGWTQAGKVTRLRRGKYLLAEPYRTQMPSVYYVSNALLHPSYVSLHTALQYHGMIPEAVGQIQAVTPKHGRTWETPVGTFRYRSIKQERFWGYDKQSTQKRPPPQQSFFMARPEKCLLDLFYLQTGEWTAERLREMRLQHLEVVDSDKLETFADRFDSPKVTRGCRRLLSLHEEDMG